MIQSRVRRIRIFKRVIHDTYLEHQCSWSYSCRALMNEVVMQSCNRDGAETCSIDDELAFIYIDKACRRARITRQGVLKPVFSIHLARHCVRLAYRKRIYLA